MKCRISKTFYRLFWLLGIIFLTIGCQSSRNAPPLGDSFSPDELIAYVAKDLGIQAKQLDPISIIHQDITGDGAPDFICILQDFSTPERKRHIYAFIGTLEGKYQLVGKNSDLLPSASNETTLSTIYMESDVKSFTLYIEYGADNGEYFVFEYRPNHTFVLSKATRGVFNYDTGQLFEFSLYEFELDKATLSNLPERIIRNRLIERSQEYKPDAQLMAVPIDSVQLPLIAPSPVTLLRTAGYERSNLPKDFKSQKWLGLFLVQGAYELRNTSLSIDTIASINKGDKSMNSDTLVRIHTTSTDSCVLLIANSKLSPRKLISIPIEQEVLWPGQIWEVPVGGSVYQWKAEGIMLNEQTDDHGNIYAHFIANYKLIMTRKVGYNVRESQTVAATPRFSETMYHIKWVGDLDGDGLLDILMDLGEKYDKERMVLYLSSYSEEKEIVHPLAETTPVRSEYYE